MKSFYFFSNMTKIKIKKMLHDPKGHSLQYSNGLHMKILVV